MFGFYDARLEAELDAYDMRLMDEWKSDMDRAGYRAESELRLAVVEDEIAMFMAEIDAEREAEERAEWEHRQTEDNWDMFDEN